MNDDIFDMAREAGIEFQRNVGVLGRESISTAGSQSIEKIERLVTLARADERESCAKVCTYKALTWRVRPVPMLGYSAELEDCAAVIRARGNT